MERSKFGAMPNSMGPALSIRPSTAHLTLVQCGPRHAQVRVPLQFFKPAARATVNSPR
jgi:hypothetical protein